MRLPWDYNRINCQSRHFCLTSHTDKAPGINKASGLDKAP